jgi:putative SOS response-associated peptidase YedK
MCYDISLHSDIELTIQAFPGIIDRRINPDFEQSEHTQSFSFPLYPVVVQREGELALMDMEWSVDPGYLADSRQRVKMRVSMANAQSERVLGDTNSYWHRIRTNRCLIPVSGTYEHREIAGWKTKVPYYIRMKERSIQHIPGLYQLMEGISPDGQKLLKGSFTMLTRTANETMKGIHNSGEHRHRMPLFLTPELEQFWVSHTFSDDDMKAVFDYCLPSELLEFNPVYTIRGKAVRPDGKNKYDPWYYNNLPALGNDQPVQPQLSLF